MRRIASDRGSRDVRFDDSLTTVLAGNLLGSGAGAGWRQLVDLLGRGRAAADRPTIDRLRDLRAEVPVMVRAASARALAWMDPPAALVELFAEDEPTVSAPVLRMARLADADWLSLLPRLDARGRSVLRHRRDLSAAVRRGLESFGAADFVLGHDVADAPESAADLRSVGEAVPATSAMPVPVRPDAEALPFAGAPDLDTGSADVARAAEADAASPAPRFEIADLIARIDGFSRDRPETPEVAAPAASFVFETDAAGTVRWVDGVARAALVGTNLAAVRGPVRGDAVVAGALRRRGRFVDARLEIGGDIPAAGSWRLSGAPLFDEATGRFTGMRGVGRRARRDQRAEAADGPGTTGADSLRQLVHELRTPANAIMGFSELIEAELLGPVPVHYRARAGTIRDEAAGLLAAVEDLDTAARIEARALDLRPGRVDTTALLDRVVDELKPLAFLRGVELVRPGAEPRSAIAADERAAERLVARLLAALVSAGEPGERLAVAEGHDADAVTITVDRPRALEADGDAALFRLDAEAEDRPGAPLLGIGFTLRLARNLAAELGGGLAIEPARLTLRLPAASDREVHTAAI